MSLKRFKIREECKFRSLHKVFVPRALHLMKIAFPNNICEIMRGEVLRTGREGSFLPFTNNQSMKIALPMKSRELSYLYSLIKDI